MNDINDMAVEILSTNLNRVKWLANADQTIRAKLELESFVSVLKRYTDNGYLSIGEAGVFRAYASEFANVLNVPISMCF